MANTYEASIDTEPADNAEFQAYVQKFEAALLASGYLEVAPDTGQITPASVTRPGTSTYAGYRMYRAKDALAGSSPFKLKVEYGIGSAASRISVRVTGGGTSDGAGTLTGLISAVTTITGTGAGSSGTIFGGGGNTKACAAVSIKDAGAQSGIFIVGRLLDSTGAPVANQSFFMFSHASGSCNYWDHTNVWLNGISNQNVFPTLGASPHTTGTASKIRAFKGITYRGGEVYELPYLIGLSSEFPVTNADASKVTSDAWGGSHIWLPGAGIIGTNTIPIFLWE